jgi:cbb3-type cytochrome oxidase maturation protein
MESRNGILYSALRTPHSALFIAMLVIFLLIFISLSLATLFLACFIWAVRTGQFEDTCTPSMRILTEEETPKTRTLSKPNT